MKILLVKHSDGSLRPSFDSDMEKLKKIKVGKMISCDVRRLRNVGFHRKFFAMINLVFNHQEVFKNIDYMRVELTKAAGFYDKYINHKGQVCFAAKSISFSKMDQDEFEDLYQRFIDVIVVAFGFDKKMIEDNLNQFYDIP